jgi:hypothetical protein
VNAVYGRIQRLGLKLNSARRRNDWTWLADDLRRYRTFEIGQRRGISLPMLNAAINRLELRHLVPSQRQCDYDAVLADLAAGKTAAEVAKAHGVSTGTVYKIRQHYR